MYLCTFLCPNVTNKCIDSKSLSHWTLLQSWKKGCTSLSCTVLKKKTFSWAIWRLKSFKFNHKVVITRNKTSRDSLRFPTPTRQFVLDWFREQIKRHSSPHGSFPTFPCASWHQTLCTLAIQLYRYHPLIPYSQLFIKSPRLTSRGPSGGPNFGGITPAEWLWLLPSHSHTPQIPFQRLWML